MKLKSKDDNELSKRSQYLIHLEQVRYKLEMIADKIVTIKWIREEFYLNVSREYQTRNAPPNDQAEPQADRARSSILKAGTVGKWSSLHNKGGWKHRLNLRLNQ